ncbi:MAG TPA: hypothetical protein VGD60_15315 [Candidatus Acidoferrales bacterium]
MKMIRRFAQVQVLLLSLLSSTVVPMVAHAEEAHGRFTLTSETHWGTAVLPAGEYTYTLATRSAMPVILLRSVKGTEAAFISAYRETSTTATTPNAITIQAIGNVKVITELHVNDAGLVLHYRAPALETAAKAADAKYSATIGK